MAADTFSTDGIGVLFQGTGNNNNTWGSNANAEIFQTLVDAIANALTNTVTGGTLDLSGSPPPAASSQVRHAALIFNGTLASNQIIKVPNLTKFWWVQNATAGAFTLVLQTPSGSASTVIPQNSGWQLIQCDGNNNIIVSPFNSVQIQMPDGSVGAPSSSYINEPKSGWYRNGTQDIRLSINGIDILQVTGAGAGTPSVMNLLVGSLQVAGGQVIPAGTELYGAFISLPSGGWLWEDGSAYSRPIASGGSVDTYKNLFNAITATVVGNTNGNTSITGLASDMRALGLSGAFVEGTGIPTGTTIVFTGATTGTLSQAASGSHVGLTLRILPWGQGDASTTFNVPNRKDLVLAARGDMGVGGDRGLLTSPLNGTRFGAGSPGGAFAGNQSVVLGQANLPSINLSTPDTSVTVIGRLSGPFTGGGSGQPIDSFTNVGGGGTTSFNYDIPIPNTPLGGSNTPVALLQPTGISNVIIKI